MRKGTYPKTWKTAPKAAPAPAAKPPRDE
jgi:hypothetical protein